MTKQWNNMRDYAQNAEHAAGALFCAVRVAGVAPCNCTRLPIIEPS